MRKNTIIMGMALFLSLILFSLSLAEETFTITTYYPSPYGSYRELRAQRMAIGDSYYGSNYCWPPDSCANQIDANADLVVEGKVGIGIASPTQKLHIVNTTEFNTLFVDDRSNAALGAYGGPALEVRRTGTAEGPNDPVARITEARPSTPGNPTDQLVLGLVGENTRNYFLGVGNPLNGNIFNPTGGGIDIYNTSNSTTAALRLRHDRATGPFIDGDTKFFVGNNGNVGIGIVNPGAKLDVNGNLNLMGNLQFTTSDTTISRVGTSRFSIGGAKWTDVEELVSPGSGTLWITGTYNAKTDRAIMFRTCGPGIGGCALIDRFAIGGRDGQGATGISSWEPLYVSATTNSYFNGGLLIGARLSQINPGIYKLYVNGKAYATGGWQGSDLRLKKNVEKLSNVLKKLENVNAVRFDWRVDEFPDKGLFEGRQIGIIAQEIEKAFPELVNTDGQGYKAFAYDRFTAVLLEAIKEQQGQIDSLKKEILELKAKSL